MKDFNKAGFNYGDILKVKISYNNEVKLEENMLFEKSFGFVNKGEPTIYNNELLKIGLAINQGNFIEKHNVDFGPEWTIEFTDRGTFRVS